MSCAATAKWQDGVFRRDHMRKMVAGRQARYLTRLVEHLKQEVVRLDAAKTPVERAKVLGAIYRKGYHNGFDVAHARLTRAQRMAS